MKNKGNLYVFMSIVVLLLLQVDSLYAIWWPQQAKFTASDGAAWDRFGCSVSISGD